MSVKNLVTSAIFLVMVVVSAAAGVQVLRQGWGDNRFSTPSDLCEWLAREDPAGQAPEIRMAAIRRFEHFFSTRADFGTAFDSIDAEGRERFRSHQAELTRLWILDKAEGYSAQPRRRRDEWLDQEIPKILQWRLIDPDQPQAGSGSVLEEGRAGLTGRLSQLAAATLPILSQATPEELERLNEFVLAVQNRILTQGPAGFGERSRDRDSVIEID
jgi:hypothetical protein